ncbi:MAG: hypothetical protein ACK42D_04520 [Candidatus Paceibacteria bacterium]
MMNENLLHEKLQKVGRVYFKGVQVAYRDGDDVYLIANENYGHLDELAEFLKSIKKHYKPIEIPDPIKKTRVMWVLKNGVRIRFSALPMLMYTELVEIKLQNKFAEDAKQMIEGTFNKHYPLKGKP